ncbi:MAG: Uncharacterized protein CEO12_190, partial [Parcubacteria group bacterium Gr01-1014_46]
KTIADCFFVIINSKIAFSYFKILLTLDFLVLNPLTFSHLTSYNSPLIYFTAIYRCEILSIIDEYMPHISSKELDKELSDKLFNDLILILNKSQNKKLLSGVVNELLTDTEKLMLAKRIAIVLLLNSKIPQLSISEILKVSTSTITMISLKMEIGKYNSILKTSQREKIDLEKIIWSIMTVGGLMPPKIGKKYWRKYAK